VDLYLLRHGAIEGGIPGTFYGATDFPLSKTGEKQAMAAGERLRGVTFQAVYISPLQRAKDTLRLAKQTAGWDEPEPIFDERLREMNFGIAEGLAYEQIKENDPVLAENIRSDWASVVFPEGESVVAFRERVTQALDEIVERHSNDERVLVVCHGGVIRLGLCHLLALPNPAFAHLHSEFARWARIRMTERWGVLQELNA
jgi:Fructose-2,6-bisphosphatase